MNETKTIFTHTVVLVQAKGQESRTYADFPTPEHAMEGIIRMYEENLRSKNTGETLTYSNEQLTEYLDSLADISCLSLNLTTNGYVPFGLDWIKEKIYTVFRNQIPGK